MTPHDDTLNLHGARVIHTVSGEHGRVIDCGYGDTFFHVRWDETEHRPSHHGWVRAKWLTFHRAESNDPA